MWFFWSEWKEARVPWVHGICSKWCDRVKSGEDTGDKIWRLYDQLLELHQVVVRRIVPRVLLVEPKGMALQHEHVREHPRPAQWFVKLTCPCGKRGQILC